MSGGARSRSGPYASPFSLRREKDKMQWDTLPEEGRQGPAPTWPLSRASKRELDLWAYLWSSPQAVMWEINRQDIEVAMHVRCVVAAEKPSATVASRTLVRQQQDSLGLSLPGMARQRWRIGAPTPERPAASQSTQSMREQFSADRRARLQVVDPALLSEGRS